MSLSSVGAAGSSASGASSSGAGDEISKKYEIRNANGIVVGYRSPAQRAERKAVIATAQSQTDYALAAVGASRTAWQREENAAASSMQRATSPPPSSASISNNNSHDDVSTASTTTSTTTTTNANNSNHHQHHRVLRVAGLRERSSSEPGDPIAVKESLGMRSNVAIPTLKLANVPGEHGAVSERVRRSARQSSQPHHHSHHHYPRQSSSQQPQLIHMPRSARSPRSVRSPRSPRHHQQQSQSPRSPRRRRGTVRRSGTHHSVVDSPRANVGIVHPSITTSSEGGGSGGVPLLSLGVNSINGGGGGGGGAVIVPASPRGLVRRNKAVSPRTRTKLRARFDAMPDSVLLLIFSFLSIEDVVLRVSLLNYRCYQLSQNSAVFESVDLSRQTMKDEAVIDLLCELGWSTLRSLAPPSTLTSRGLHALSTCRSLGVLQLRSNPTISSHLLQRVVEYAEWQLHTIDLTGIIVTDEVVLALADRFDHCLESLALVQMTPLAVTDRSVAHLMRQCHVLRHVSLRSCRSVTPLAFEDISSEQLESVDVADCNELDDRFVKRLTKIAPRLRSLVLSGLTRISDKPLIDLLRGAAGLRDLALAECAQLTDAVLTTLTRKASLDLRSLDLVALPLLTAAAIVPFVEKQCAHLQRMRFDHSPAARCEPVLHALANKCAATLTFLNLRHGDAQTQLSAESLAVLPRFTHLQHLDVSECGDNVTAMLLGELFGQVRWLRELFADGCRGLTNQLIRKLMLAFERDMFDLKLGSLALLERISLVGCESVSQEALLDGFRTHRPRCVVNL